MASRTTHAALTQMERRVKRVISKAETAGRRAMRETARVGQRDMRRRLATPYPPASAPGEYPHRRTGELMRGVSVRRVARDAWALYTNVYYAIYLEWGTRNMAARPHWRPTREMMVAELRERVRRDVARAVRGALRG